MYIAAINLIEICNKRDRKDHAFYLCHEMNFCLNEPDVVSFSFSSWLQDYFFLQCNLIKCVQFLRNHIICRSMSNFIEVFFSFGKYSSILQVWFSFFNLYSWEHLKILLYLLYWTCIQNMNEEKKNNRNKTI